MLPKKSKFCELLLNNIYELYTLNKNLQYSKAYSFYTNYISAKKKEEMIKRIHELEDLIHMLKNTTNYENLSKIEKMIISSKEKLLKQL